MISERIIRKARESKLLSFDSFVRLVEYLTGRSCWYCAFAISSKSSLCLIKPELFDFIFFRLVQTLNKALGQKGSLFEPTQKQKTHRNLCELGDLCKRRKELATPARIGYYWATR